MGFASMEQPLLKVILQMHLQEGTAEAIAQGFTIALSLEEY